MTRILVIDDDDAFGTSLRDTLTEAGYEVQTVTNGHDGLRATFQFRPQAILLDVMMPEMDGWQTCLRLREFYDGLILFLTVRNDELDRIKGFDLGADDYLAKPFSIAELLARLRSRLRQAQASTAGERPTYVDRSLTIDLDRGRVTRDGQPVEFTPTEQDILFCLVRHAGTVLSHKQLLSEALGQEYANERNYLKVYIGRIREKLEADPKRPKYILTHRGRGYSFAPSHRAER